MAEIYTNAKISKRTELELDDTALIHDFVLITCKKLKMGKDSQINAGTRIIGKDEVIIGDYCVVGYNSVLITTTDTPEGKQFSDQAPEDKRKLSSGPIIMKDNSFIGSLSVIMPDVILEEGTFIGAHSFVWTGERTEKNGVYWGSPIQLQYLRLEKPEEEEED